MKWVDDTSYSRTHPRGTIEPNAWRLKADGIRLVVHRLHAYEGWYVSANEVHIDRRALKAATAEEAQREGVALVRAHLELYLKRLNKAAPPSGTGETK